MNLVALVPDNMTEVLLKVLRFTELRRDVLYRNLRQAEDPNFQPQDMPVGEFAAALDAAVAEHLQSRRLVFRDTDNVRFGPNGSMEVQAVCDSGATTLLQTDRNAYVRHQKQLWRENALNQLVAQELLDLTCGDQARAVRLHNGVLPADPKRFAELWKPCENAE
jgi:flagellar basal body rod protein FlgB